MSLAKAIQQTLTMRGLTAATVAHRLGEEHDRATFYRLLSGATTDPRLTTLIQLCKALEVSPTEFVQLAGLWSATKRPADVLDFQLREAFARLHELQPADKRHAVDLMHSVAHAWQPQSEPQPEAVEAHS